LDEPGWNTHHARQAMATGFLTFQSGWEGNNRNRPSPPPSVLPGGDIDWPVPLSPGVPMGTDNGDRSMQSRLLILMSLLCMAQRGFTAGPCPASSRLIQQYSKGATGLNGRVTDSRTGGSLPSRIVLQSADGETVQSYYRWLPGCFTEEDGSFHFDLEPGDYTLSVFHGIDFLSHTHHLEIKENRRLDVTVALEPWIELRKLGWFNGDGHAHLYTEKRPDDEMLATARKICLAQGVDFLFANQGWGGYDEENYRESYARFSDDRFSLHYGAEMPKYRTGHTWWVNLSSCRHSFDAAMDTVYENQYYQVEDNPTWDFSSLNFPSIPDVEIVSRFKKEQNALACVPHPTSWWWQERGSSVKYVTNACAYLPFGLLSGRIWDAMVVMGYDTDHYFYQNLWFHVLNEGYRMPAVAELDGGYGEGNKFPYGSIRVYYQAGDRLSPENAASALRRGRTFVTSGPVILADIDGFIQFGDLIRADASSHTLHVDAYASGNREDYLSYVIVFRNGKIHHLWDLRNQKPRFARKSLQIFETEDAWYAVKAYGKKAWKNPENLDVMAVCRRIQDGFFPDEPGGAFDICMTSPFYFFAKDSADSACLQSNVHLTLVHPRTQEQIGEACIKVMLDGEVTDSLNTEDGQARFTMPVNAMLVISAEGLPAVRRGLFLDYPPHREIIESLANGNWMARKNWKSNLKPGQIPWEAFQFNETKKILRDVRWTIEMKPNERDRLWEDFDRLFR
jgi:hypothetical protein